MDFDSCVISNNKVLNKFSDNCHSESVSNIREYRKNSESFFDIGRYGKNTDFDDNKLKDRIDGILSSNENFEKHLAEFGKALELVEIIVRDENVHFNCIS